MNDSWETPKLISQFADDDDCEKTHYEKPERYDQNHWSTDLKKPRIRNLLRSLTVR